MKLGIDRLISDKKIQDDLKDKRIALVGHPASVDSNLIPSLDVLFKNKNLNITSAFGPQHGLRGDKQDNMVESFIF